MNARTEPQLLGRISNRHLDALEEEAIFILREVAGAFERPTLLFSGGKDSLVLLRCAEKAFGTGPHPLPAADDRHRPQLPEVTDFRDFRAAELGAELIVRSVEDSMKRGTVRLAHPDESRNAPPVGDAAGGDRGIPLRRADRRRPPRRGEGPRQGAHLLPPRRLRPVAAQGPAPRAVDAVQHAPAARRALPRVPHLQLDRAGRVAVHRARAHRAALDLLRAPAPGDRAPRAAGAGDRGHAAQGRRGGRDTRTVRFRTVGDITCTCPVESPAANATEVVAETLLADVSERGATRMDDKTSDASMEKRKKDGYF